MNSDPTIDNPIITPQQVLGWGVLYVMLIAAADIPGLGKISAAFAWLLLLSIALFYGVDAANGLNSLMSGNRNITAPNGDEGVVIG